MRPILRRSDDSSCPAMTQARLQILYHGLGNHGLIVRALHVHGYLPDRRSKTVELYTMTVDATGVAVVLLIVVLAYSEIGGVLRLQSFGQGVDSGLGLVLEEVELLLQTIVLSDGLA